MNQNLTIIRSIIKSVLCVATKRDAKDTRGTVKLNYIEGKKKHVRNYGMKVV